MNNKREKKGNDKKNAQTFDLKKAKPELWDENIRSYNIYIKWLQYVCKINDIFSIIGSLKISYLVNHF